MSKELVRLLIKKLGFSHKKAKFFAAPKHLKETTAEFVKLRNWLVNEQKYIVSLDETSFGRHGKSMYGYSPKGTPLKLSKNPMTKAKPTSVIAIIDNNGIVAKEHLEGAYNT